MDGQIDDVSTDSPTQSKPNNSDKNLYDVIRKVTANTQRPNKVIELRELPPSKRKFCLTDGIKKKPINPITSKSVTDSPKVHRPKEQPTRETKSAHKIKPRLLPSVLKNNGDVVRPFPIRSSSIHADIQVNIKINKSNTSLFYIFLESFSSLIRKWFT